jgi:hypothetical protein
VKRFVGQLGSGEIVLLCQEPLIFPHRVAGEPAFQRKRKTGGKAAAAQLERKDE